MKKGRMVIECFCLAGVISAVIASGARAASDAAASTVPAMPAGGGAFFADPVVAGITHVLFIAVIIGMGAAVVAALFKPPFEN